ncbi:MAG: phosphonate ABC transporter ATP-binding protein [Syntrophales bacterium]|nr:phosphonate ABC transporter ATP-binding protein [Syntrophales bacterium]
MLRIENISKRYPNGTLALEGVNLHVEEGDFVTILGPSGAGKSTLLRIINRLVDPTGGRLCFDGVELIEASHEELRSARRRIGFIFQQFNLIKRISVLKNVLAGRLGYGKTMKTLCYIFSKGDTEHAIDCLSSVGMAQYSHQRADTLSGGQQQRVAIAKALVQEPRLILADEPIASIDPRSADAVMKLLRTANEEKGITVMVNLHFVDYARRYSKRVIGINNGGIVFDGPVSDLSASLVKEIYASDSKRKSDDEQEFYGAGLAEGFGRSEFKPEAVILN